jgi:hypothetical protein
MDMATILLVVLGSMLVSVLMLASDRVKAHRLARVHCVAVDLNR